MRHASPWRECDALRRFANDAAKVTAAEVGIAPDMIFSSLRFRKVATCRHVVAFLLREHAFARGLAREIGVNCGAARVPYAVIAQIIGWRDHTTAISSIKKISEMIGDRRFQKGREFIRRAALDLQSLGYCPSDLSAAFAEPPAFERQAGMSKAVAVSQTKRDQKREAVPSLCASVRAGRSYIPAKRRVAGDQNQSERNSA